MNIGKWVLRNLFIGFIREEQRRHSQDGTLQPSINRATSHDVLDPKTPTTPNRFLPSFETSKLLSNAVNVGTVVSSSNMSPAMTPTVIPNSRSSPLLTPLIPLHYSWKDAPLSSIPQSPISIQDTIKQRVTTDASNLPSPNILKDDYFGTRTRQQSGNLSNSDDFSGWSGPSKPEPQTPSTPSGLMGRLRNFGKMAKRSIGDGPSISTPATAIVGSSTLSSVSTNNI